MNMCKNRERKPGWAELECLPAQWNLYKDLVRGIPDDIGIVDMCIGDHWVFVEAECGCGMALTVRGGRGSYGLGSNALYMSLRDLASQVTSWNFIESSVGVAALNAWYSTYERAQDLGMVIEEKGSNDAFEMYRRLCAGKRVCVVGHFPLIERLADECELTVLERNPHGDDVPDPGCEFIIPNVDFTFITGITLTNKTMPRLLQLSKSSSGSCIMVGPSVVPSAVLYEYGVDCMAGSVITDPERAKAAILHAESSGVFGRGVQKMRVERPGWIDGLSS